jgi:hypothetical protein
MRSTLSKACGVDIVNNNWVVYQDQSTQKAATKDEYSNGIQNLGLYEHEKPAKVNVDALPNKANLRVFREGASVQWEDYKNGGQMSMRFKKSQTKQKWNELMNAIMSGKLPHVSTHVVGAVLSIRPGSNAAHLWCVNNEEVSKNHEILKFIGENLGVHVVYLPFQVLTRKNTQAKAKKEKAEASPVQPKQKERFMEPIEKVDLAAEEDSLSAAPTPSGPGSQTPDRVSLDSEASAEVAAVEFKGLDYSSNSSKMPSFTTIATAAAVVMPFVGYAMSFVY